MKGFLHRLFQFIAYTAAGVVILLAIAVGLFRLFLPRLAEYQEDIKGWATAAIGMQVEFSGMDARWGLSGPELVFYDSELIRPGTEVRLVAAEEVRVGVGLTRLLFEGKRVVDHVVVRETSVEVRQLEDGRWWIQGSLLEDLLGPKASGATSIPDVEVIGEDIQIIFLQPGDERPKFFDIPRATASINRNRLALDADVRLPDELGRQLSVAATQIRAIPKEERHWDVVVEADNVNLAGWSGLCMTGEKRVLSGTGDVDLSIAYANGGVRNASAEVEFADILLEQDEPFGIAGRFELNVADDNWLVAAEEFQITKTDHEWPEASLIAEFSTDDEGQIVMMDVRASYLNLDDSDLFIPFLSPEQQQQLESFEPGGIVRDLIATVSDIDTESPRFDVAAELENVGIAAEGKRPGVRGFSGVLRANRLGGRIEIRSTGMRVELPEYLLKPVDIDSAEGTIIWRSTDKRTTIVSDSIRIRNSLFDSRSNVQLMIDGGQTAPEIDLESTWSITDLSEMTQYIPQKIIKPKLYDWFQSALVKGSIPRGTTKLNGPLDKFPFDNGEGRFLLEGSVRNLIFKYQPRWPAAETSDMDVVLDGMRLYSISNRSLSAGNQTIDAKIEIADLRDPVLTIEAL
jgi:uncharacterized protein YhdP